MAGDSQCTTWIFVVAKQQTTQLEYNWGTELYSDLSSPYCCGPNSTQLNCNSNGKLKRSQIYFPNEMGY